MKYVYGPVPSRRLGQSLGIDTIPLKTCNWNCVYCQLGRTVPLTNKRREYFPREDILAEVKSSLAAHRPAEIDWITIVGSGEPTLHIGIGSLIREIKAMTDLPLAVITNGALLHMPEVREELSVADAVLPSLDAGSQILYRQINRAHPDITFKRHLNGLIDFRKIYKGKLWIEVMLVFGLNDDEESLCTILDSLQQIQPDEVHINIPTRPPVETWVQTPNKEGLMRARAILGKTARIIHPASGSFDLSGFASIKEAVISIITRHPMQEEEILRTLDKWSSDDVTAILADIKGSGEVQIIERYGTRFWTTVKSHFPDDGHRRVSKPEEMRNLPSQ